MPRYDVKLSTIAAKDHVDPERNVVTIVDHSDAIARKDLWEIHTETVAELQVNVPETTIVLRTPNVA